MPNKDPSFFQLLQQFFVMAWAAITNSPAMQGGVMAFVIAALRTLYFDKEPKPVRIFLESLLCAALAIGIYGVIKWWNLPDELGVGLGAGIGFVGVTALHDLIIRFLNNKAGDK